jgi:hypothetical protein
MMKYCHSILHEKWSQVFMAYPSSASSQYPDSILVFNFDDKSWSTFSYDMSCMGLWGQDYNAGTQGISQGYPQLVAGTRNGQVVLLDQPNQPDLSGAITCNILTGQLNPYSKKLTRAMLGWVDFFVDTNTNGAMNINIYGDGHPSPYLSLTEIPLSDGLGNDKSFIRIPTNCEANFHQIQITHSTPDQLVIHAIIPWAKEGGRMSDRGSFPTGY